MKIKTIKFRATIPTRQYENIQPEIEIEDIEDEKEATEYAKNWVKEHFSSFSEHGSLKEKDVVLTKEIPIGIVKKSFNEDVEIIFNPNGTPRYTYNNKSLKGVTDYISNTFYKKFDIENISKAFAKSQGLEQSDVKGIWKSNGNVSSNFGTAIHEALEHYDVYKSSGAIIQTNKELEDNYCIPKHPLIKSIVKGFLKIDNSDGNEIITEALITDVKKGFCGHADRIVIIDRKKKICRVQDYKINIESDVVDRKNKVLSPFDELPSTKLSKYQIQMSMYANMLQKSGWTVEGLDVFVLEDEWKLYALELLEVIK